MSVLALVTKREEVELVVRWASEFATARQTTLSVLCCAYTPVVQYALISDEETASATDELVTEVQRVLALPLHEGQPPTARLSADQIPIRRVLHPDTTAATLQRIRTDKTELVVAAASDQTGRSGATYSSNPLLRQSPCDTVILFGGFQRSTNPARILVGARSTAHDRTAALLAAAMAETSRSRVTMARVEDDIGEAAKELGLRELREMMRGAGLKQNKRIRRRVFLAGDVETIASAANQHHLVIVGANDQLVVSGLVETTTNPTIAVIKRAPPLQPWYRQQRNSTWVPRLSPGDYADMVQSLRRGSQLNADFLIMLGLAAAIASLGLLQDSPAVVIGSMLLAPLMTPMVTSGLAVAQANPTLGRRSLVTILYGLLVTLAISFMVAELTPGEEMTSQVLARGSPNILDLLIALFSAAAAAYAMARPNLVGAMAGVAIATALVPPLCSVGVSLAYRQFTIAAGATVLFATNFVAIVLAAAITFRLLGVTPSKANAWQRRWVYRMVGGFGIAVIVLAYPLQQELDQSIARGKLQPSTYPLTKAVEEALVEHIEKTPDVELVASGRPSTLHDEADVVIFLMTPHALPETYGQELVAIVRREMEDSELVVEVHSLQQAREIPSP